MGKIYREFFYVPKYGKVTDKVMTARVILSAFVIIGCLTALSLSAYAWFSFSISSGTNTIQTADFDITASVTSAEPNAGVYTLENGEYTVLLTKTGNAKTGFCVVEITAGETTAIFHTQQLGQDGQIERGELSFRLTVSELTEPVTVKFTPHWGTSAYYSDNDGSCYIENESIVRVTAEGITTAEEPQQEQLPEEQLPEEEPELPAEDLETPVDPEQEEIVHTVKEGENLTWIANDYNTTPEAIAERNGLTDMRTLQIGQQLIIPVAQTATEESE